MGSKPKKTEAGASEKASSQVATAQYARYKEKYLPEMLAERDRTTNVDQRDYFRGKAQADTMQGLTGSGNTTIASIGAVDTTADRASSEDSSCYKQMCKVQQTKRRNNLMC